jgi:hypothetical protein
LYANGIHFHQDDSWAEPDGSPLSLMTGSKESWHTWFSSWPTLETVEFIVCLRNIDINRQWLRSWLPENQAEHLNRVCLYICHGYHPHQYPVDRTDFTDSFEMRRDDAWSFTHMHKD